MTMRSAYPQRERVNGSQKWSVRRKIENCGLSLSYDQYAGARLLIDREEGETGYDTQVMFRHGTPALRRLRLRLLVDEVEAKRHVTAIVFLSLVDHADVDGDVIERESDLHQLTDDVMCVALPARPAHRHVVNAPAKAFWAAGCCVKYQWLLARGKFLVFKADWRTTVKWQIYDKTVTARNCNCNCN